MQLSSYKNNFKKFRMLEIIPVILFMSVLFVVPYYMEDMGKCFATPTTTAITIISCFALVFLYFLSRVQLFKFLGLMCPSCKKALQNSQVIMASKACPRCGETVIES